MWATLRENPSNINAKIHRGFNPFMPTVPTFAGRETDVSWYNGGTSGAPIIPRDVSLSDSKCWNGGHEWVKRSPILGTPYAERAEPLEQLMQLFTVWDMNIIKT